MKASLACVMVVVAGSVAQGAITGVTGQTTWLGSPPASCVSGALTAPVAFVWDEQQGVTTGGVLVDEVQNPGGSTSPLAGVIAGTFDSHFLHHQGIPGIVGVQGSVTFATPIVGVIFRALNLDNTDVGWGSFGTVYPTTFPLRGMGTGPFNFFNVNGNTFTYSAFSNLSVGDVVQYRILTQAVPAPGAAGLLGLAGVAACRRGRRA